MRPAPRRLLIVIAVAHLLLVMIGAAGVRLRDVGAIGRLLYHYGHISGAVSGYGFFAPEVRGQLVLRFDVIDPEGRTTTTSLETGVCHEADHRVAGIASEFTTKDPQLRRDLAASLAAKLFALHPQAREVVVIVENFVSVSMEEHRNGRRLRPLPVYQARFQRARGQTEGYHGTVDPG